LRSRVSSSKLIGIAEYTIALCAGRSARFAGRGARGAVRGAQGAGRGGTTAAQRAQRLFG